MTTTDQLRKDINELKDEIVNLKRTNDNYEKQLNKQTSSTGTVEWTTITTWITEKEKQISAIQSQISAIQSQIAEKERQISLIAQREITALEAQATAEKEKEKEGGTIVLLFFFPSSTLMFVSNRFIRLSLHSPFIVRPPLLSQPASGTVCIRFSSSCLVWRCDFRRRVLRLEPDRRVPSRRHGTLRAHLTLLIHVYQVPRRRSRRARTRKARTAVVWN